ncbi:MAG TPA: RDD family protein [Streptosporangiaceae bacterium]
MTEVVTGEAVVLDLQVARFPSRIAAVLLDMLVQIVVLIAITIGALKAAGHADGAAVAGITLSAYVVVVVGYSTAFETLTRGKTLGKMALGLRVVSDDGSPVRFRQALIRALTGAIEIWSLIGAPVGLVTSLVSEKGKRLGDMFAGTYVIQERAARRPMLPPELAAVPPPLAGWAQAAQVSGLNDWDAEAADSYLRRLHQLSPAASAELGLRIATTVAGQVSPPPPPGTPPAAYLAAVLAVRRDREHARLGTQPAVTGAGAPEPAGPGWAPPGQPGSTAPGWALPGETSPGVAPVTEPPHPAGPAAGSPTGSGGARPGGFVPPA